MGLGCEWRHSRKRWAGILGDFEKKKKAVSWDPKLGEVSWDLKLDEASPAFGLRDAPRVCWVRWNGQHSKNCVSLSSCRKPKSQEGKKSFLPEQRESSSVSRDSYACERFTYPYICIVASWLCNKRSMNNGIQMLRIKSSSVIKLG